jgi:hypothetical protein
MNESDVRSNQLDADLARAQAVIEEQRAVITALADLVCELMQVLADYENSYPVREMLYPRSYPN